MKRKTLSSLLSIAGRNEEIINALSLAFATGGFPAHSPMALEMVRTAGHFLSNADQESFQRSLDDLAGLAAGLGVGAAPMHRAERDRVLGAQDQVNDKALMRTLPEWLAKTTSDELAGVLGEFPPSLRQLIAEPATQFVRAKTDGPKLPDPLGQLADKRVRTRLLNDYEAYVHHGGANDNSNLEFPSQIVAKLSDLASLGEDRGPLLQLVHELLKKDDISLTPSQPGQRPLVPSDQRLLLLREPLSQLSSRALPTARAQNEVLELVQAQLRPREIPARHGVLHAPVIMNKAHVAEALSTLIPEIEHLPAHSLQGVKDAQGMAIDIMSTALKRKNALPLDLGVPLALKMMEHSPQWSTGRRSAGALAAPSTGKQIRRTLKTNAGLLLLPVVPSAVAALVGRSSVQDRSGELIARYLGDKLNNPIHQHGHPAFRTLCRQVLADPSQDGSPLQAMALVAFVRHGLPAIDPMTARTLTNEQKSERLDEWLGTDPANRTAIARRLGSMARGERTRKQSLDRAWHKFNENPNEPLPPEASRAGSAIVLRHLIGTGNHELPEEEVTALERDTSEAILSAPHHKGQTPPAAETFAQVLVDHLQSGAIDPNLVRRGLDQLLRGLKDLSTRDVWTESKAPEGATGPERRRAAGIERDRRGYRDEAIRAAKFIPMLFAHMSAPELVRRADTAQQSQLESLLFQLMPPVPKATSTDKDVKRGAQAASQHLGIGIISNLHQDSGPADPARNPLLPLALDLLNNRMQSDAQTVAVQDLMENTFTEEGPEARLKALNVLKGIVEPSIASTAAQALTHRILRNASAMSDGPASEGGAGWAELDNDARWDALGAHAKEAIQFVADTLAGKLSTTLDPSAATGTATLKWSDEVTSNFVKDLLLDGEPLPPELWKSCIGIAGKLAPSVRRDLMASWISQVVSGGTGWQSGLQDLADDWKRSVKEGDPQRDLLDALMTIANKARPELRLSASAKVRETAHGDLRDILPWMDPAIRNAAKALDVSGWADVNDLPTQLQELSLRGRTEQRQSTITSAYEVSPRHTLAALASSVGKRELVPGGQRGGRLTLGQEIVVDAGRNSVTTLREQLEQRDAGEIAPSLEMLAESYFQFLDQPDPVLARNQLDIEALLTKRLPDLQEPEKTRVLKTLTLSSLTLGDADFATRLAKFGLDPAHPAVAPLRALKHPALNEDKDKQEDPADTVKRAQAHQALTELQASRLPRFNANESESGQASVARSESRRSRSSAEEIAADQDLTAPGALPADSGRGLAFGRGLWQRARGAFTSRKRSESPTEPAAGSASPAPATTASPFRLDLPDPAADGEAVDDWAAYVQSLSAASAEIDRGADTASRAASALMGMDGVIEDEGTSSRPAGSRAGADT